jgi:short-subunit dehydrogenase
MTITLRGKPIIITGASAGIGAATARLLAAQGMPVILAARRLDALESIAKEIRAQGGTALALAADVSRDDENLALVTRCRQEFGLVYAILANAGYGFECPTATLDDARLRAIFETNFFGTASLIRAALPHMLHARAGHVLITSSCVSKLGIPYLAAYSATKAAQDHLGRALRVELAATGVFCSTIHPIGTTTEFFDVARRHSTVESFVERTPKLFMQPPERVARAIARCLRSPKGEVWTSLPTRLAMAFATAFPGLADRLLRAKFGARAPKG